MSVHHLLVGTGIAALAAAEAIREADPGARITLVGEEPHPFYSRPGLAYLLDRSLAREQLRIRSAEEVRDLRLDRLQGRIAAVDPREHRAGLADGRTLGWDRLLVATGAESAPADFPGAELDGVLRLDGLDGALEIIRRARTGLRRRRAVVVGGGSTALEIVEGLHARGVETHYLLRGERYWSRVLDGEESRIVEDRLEAEGVVLHRGAEVDRAEGRKGRLQAVVTRSGERIPCDLLAVAIGVRPRLEVARSAGLETDRGILTDEYLRTSAPDVLAAGDVVQVRGPDGRGGQLDTLWQSAQRQGHAAGLTMAGVPTPYRAGVPLNVTRLAGVVTTIVGAVDGGGDDPDLLTLTRGQSERWRGNVGDRTFRSGRRGDRVRLLVGARSLTGALVMGDQTPSLPIVDLITRAVDLSPLRPRLEAHPEAAVALVLDLHRRIEEGPHAGTG